MKAAIDELADKLVRQVRDLHDKRVTGRKRVTEPEPGDEPDLENPLETGLPES
jgi:hypothetical protein